MRRISGVRGGRPDYSFVSTIPIAPARPAGILQIYWNGREDADPGMEAYCVPSDPFGNTFPRANKVLKVKKVVVSIDADVLIGLDLVHVIYEGWAKFKRGEITFEELLRRYSYCFATELGYQRIELRPELYSIRSPDVFMIGLINADPENKRTMYFYWNGEEHG